MSMLIVVKNPKDWPIKVPNVQVVSSKEYLVNARFSKLQGLHVYNLCRSYRYQSSGYYVSLLAEARNHKPVPSVATIKDMKSSVISRIMTEDLEDYIQKDLKDIVSGEFELSVYFGKNTAKKYDRLSKKIYDMFEAPLLRAYFVRKKEWILKRIRIISVSEVPENHQDFLIERAQSYFKRKYPVKKKSEKYRYDIAILCDSQEKNPPSDEAALRKFALAARKNGLNPDFITRDDYSRIAEYDALFIRTTTSANDYTYRFARRAQAEGLAVIDDPESIIRCTNKIYLSELLELHNIPAPKTMILYRGELQNHLKKITFPCIVKLPDSAFSLGVKKAAESSELEQLADGFFEKSDLILVQEFIPTEYDWRIGILDGRILYACKYFMAQKHWQILKQTSSGRMLAGNVKCFPVHRVPEQIRRTALDAANLIGSGLYGVDMKLSDEGKPYVIEINDNPSIEHNYEDGLLKDRLYDRVMKSFAKRIERLRKS